MGTHLTVLTPSNVLEDDLFVSGGKTTACSLRKKRMARPTCVTTIPQRPILRQCPPIGGANWGY
jgi:hypothetical protein